MLSSSISYVNFQISIVTSSKSILYLVKKISIMCGALLQVINYNISLTEINKIV